MGFEIMIEIEAGGTSSKVNQFDEDGKVGAPDLRRPLPGAAPSTRAASMPTSATRAARLGGSSTPTSAA